MECKVCGDTNEDEFYKGNKSRCKACSIACAKEWHALHPERARELNNRASKKYRQKHPEGVKNRALRYLDKNRERNKNSPFIYLSGVLKKCAVCKVYLAPSCFTKSCSKWDGLEGYCRDCNKVLTIHWRRNNRERGNKIARKSYHKHKDRARARGIANYHIKGREICSVHSCEELGEKHHPDYTKPLEIIWLCRKHHYQSAHRSHTRYAHLS